MQLYDLQWIYIVRDVLICLVALICMGSTAVFMQRKQPRIVWLVITGFALLGLEPIADFVVWQLLVTSEIDSVTLDWLFAVPSACGMIFGMICLTAALVLATRPLDTTSNNDDEVFDGLIR